MKRRWTPEELAEQWTLSADEFALLDTKTDHNRLGFALLLKFFTIEGRFPRSSSELPEAAVVHVSRQVQVAPGRLRFYQSRGRSIKDHRAQIRAHLGFRYARVEDAEALATWLAGHPEASTASFEQLGAIVGQRCRELHLEPPAPDRVQRLVRSAVRRAHERFCEELWSHLPPSAIEALDALLDPSADDDAPGLSLAALKADPGRPTLDSVLTEIAKLGALRAVGLPPELFRGAPPKLLARLRQRAAAEPPRELRAHPEPLRYTLLATLCYLRLQEITDNLVELLIGVIHKINFRAEQRVEQELLAELRRVPDKHDLLYDLAAASLANPDSLVRDVVFPVVGEQTLWALVAEQQALGGPYRKRVHTVMRASYAGHYRQMLPHVLTALEFRSNNVLHQPVIRALELLKQFAGRQTQFYQAHTQAPIEGVVRPKWRKLLLEAGRHEGCACPVSTTRSVCLRRCARSSAARKCGWSAPTAGATPTRTCPLTSTSAATTTTRRWFSPASRRPSSSRCASG